MNYIIIVSGGKGLRMGSDIPKQYMEVGGKPILMHTIEQFYTALPDVNIILVLAADRIEYWNELCKKYSFDIKHDVVAGGKERFYSVKNALDIIPDNAEGVVGVHDGVRPFVSYDVIKQTYQKADAGNSVVPVMPLVESVRKIDGGLTKAVDRKEYVSVQTPQVFPINVLKKAYSQEYKPCFTDDASVVENMGVKIVTTEGNKENIKITTPFDLIIAEKLINKE